MGASGNGNLEIVKYLMKNGALDNAKNKFATIALMEASYDGHFNVIEYLLEQGADTNATNTSGQAASDIVKILIDSAADVNTYNGDGRSALMMASDAGNTEIINLLKNAGAKE